MKRALLGLVLIGGVAHASPIQLTKDQIVAAEKAAQAKLPPVDKAKLAVCQKELDTANGHTDPPASELMQIATCWRGAGSLGAAVQMWTHVLADTPSAPEAIEATRQLGPAYEAAGMYAEAAQAHADYGAKYPKEADARDKTVRAVCIWEQLGDTDDAAKGLVALGHWKQKFSPATLCDKVRPIQPPAPAKAP